MANEVVTLLPGEAEEDPEVVDRVVQGIREIHLRRGLEYYLELGQFIIDEMFGGDYAALEARRGKHKSFRALEKRDDLPLSYVTLNAAVRVRQQYEALPEGLREQLTMGHHKALLPLGSDDDRLRFASDASKNGWTVERLKEAVRSRVDEVRSGDKRGRRPLPRFEKTLNMFDRVLQDAEAFGDLEQVERLDDGRTEKIRKTLSALRARCDQLERDLGFGNDK